MADGIVFDGSNLERLARDMRHAALRVRAETDKTLVTIGGEITLSAKAIASQHSQTVAGTIRMRAVPGAVIVAAGSEDVAIAALWELGNKRSKVTDPTFRHPVWGHRDRFVDQPRYPFLRPALALNRRQVTKRMEDTWDELLRPYGMRTY